MDIIIDYKADQNFPTWPFHYITTSSPIFGFSQQKNIPKYHAKVFYITTTYPICILGPRRDFFFQGGKINTELENGCSNNKKLAEEIQGTTGTGNRNNLMSLSLNAAFFRKFFACSYKACIRIWIYILGLRLFFRVGRQPIRGFPSCGWWNNFVTSLFCYRQRMRTKRVPCSNVRSRTTLIPWLLLYDFLFEVVTSSATVINTKNDITNIFIRW